MLRDALVVGVSNYQYLSTLNAPAHDAEAIAQLLESQGDFRVTRLPEIVQDEKLRIGVKTPVTLATLETALVKLFKPKGNNVPHTALFYFSGHGLQKEAGISEGYLATSETNPAGHFYGLSLFWLRRLLQESPVRQRIVLLDCCHSGEILNYLEADPGAKAGTDRLFMAASREYETAYESLSGRYSVFTQALLEGLDPRRMHNGIVTNYALTDWVSNALKGELQQPLFENSGSEIVLTRCQTPTTVMQSLVTTEICPYRGLEPFDEEHAEYFFGRESLTDQLVDKLRTGNFVTVVGASGSGKSSLVKAGLVYKLRRGQALSGSDRWQIRVLTPTDNPFRSLANAFVHMDASAVERAEQLRRAEAFLQGGTAGLTQLIRASLIAANKNTRLLLVIDQFEEIFTLCQGNNAERDRHRFFQSLLTALQTLNEQFSLVIVLRADFFSKCSFYSGLAEQLEQHLVTVTPLTYDQIKASILKPAEKVGLVCEPNLVYNILLDIVGAPGELPLLQYTLMELWQRRQCPVEGGPPHLTLDTYAELGGVRGTLQKRANEMFYSLSLDEQRIARRIFIALTHLGEGTEDTRRRVLKSELISAQGASELVERVLEKLVVAKLVVTNQITTVGSYQEQVDQRFANVSTALRLAQMMRQKTTQTTDLTVASSSALPAADPLNAAYSNNIARLSQVNDLTWVQSSGYGNQETVDIAHEALIRNWALLRSWLDENREMLRRQRQIERTAREWQLAHRSRSPEYLLRGSRLVDAEDFLYQYPGELSPLAQSYIGVSQEVSRRTRRDLRLLQVTVPCTLMVALGLTFTQYRTTVKTRAEKDQQLRVATSRQWSAIAQSLSQEADYDPTTALLISRLAAEQGYTYESESSLRSALQELRLQAHWQVSQKPVQQMAFSPDYAWLATADADGQLRLWSLKDRSVNRKLSRQGNSASHQSLALSAIAFSRDGQFLVTCVPSQGIQVWSVERGELQRELAQGSSPIDTVAIDPNRDQVAVSRGKVVQIWNLATGQLQSQGIHASPVKQLQFSQDSNQLVITDAQSVTLVQINGYRLQKKFTPGLPFSAAQLSPNQQWLAIATANGMIGLWNTQTGKRMQLAQPFAQTNAKIDLTAPVQLVFSPDSTTVASLNGGGQTKVIQVSTGRQWSLEQPVAEPPAEKRLPPIAIAFNPNSQQIAITRTQAADNNQDRVSLRDPATGQEIYGLRRLNHPIQTLQFSPDGTMLATAGTDGTVQLWRTEPGGELASLKLPSNTIQWAGFQLVANGAQPLMSSAPAAPTNAIARSNPPNADPASPLLSELMLMIGTDGALQQWDMMSLSPGAIAAASSPPTDDAFSFQTIVQNGKIFHLLHDVGKWFWTFDEAYHQGTDNTALLNSIQPNLPANSAIAEASGQPQPTLDATTSLVMPTQLAKSVLQLGNNQGSSSWSGRLTAATANRSGTLIAIATSSGGAELWSMQNNKPMQRMAQLQDDPNAPTSDNPTDPTASLTPNRDRKAVIIHHLAFSQDGQQLLGVGVDKVIRIWKVETGELLHQLVGHEALVDQASFSADGQRVISASWDRTARIWEVASGKLLTTLTQPDVVTSAHFSPDGQRLLLTSLNGSARVVDADTGTVQVILAGHRGAVLDGDFSPDGKLLVTASADGSARLWDANTGVERAILRAGRPGMTSEAVNRAFFSPDGRYVATLSSSGNLNIWVATWDELLKLARDRSLRRLKPDECLRYLRLTPQACPSLELGNATQP